MAENPEKAGTAGKPIEDRLDTYPQAEIVDVIAQSKDSLLLELRANIGGQPQPISLSLSASSSLGLTDPVAVDALHRLRGVIWDLHFGLGHTLSDLKLSIDGLSKAIASRTQNQ